MYRSRLIRLWYMYFAKLRFIICKIKSLRFNVISDDFVNFNKLCTQEYFSFVSLLCVLGIMKLQHANQYREITIWCSFLGKYPLPPNFIMWEGERLVLAW